MRCAICGNITDRKVKFNFMEVYREAHEWSDLPQIGVPCRECIGWIRDKDAFQNMRLRTEPIPHVVGPQRFWPDVSATAIGIFDGELLGLRCAKVRHGVDMVTEVLQGYWYQSENGKVITRATVKDVDEKERCESCHLSLWACNALEVTV
jgi:hypothetical protein